MSEDIILLSRPDATSAGSVLAEAFIADPLWRSLYEDELQRSRILERFFNALIRTAIARQHAHGAGVPLDGVAVWRPPEDRSWGSPSSLVSWLPLLASSFPLKALSVRRVFTEFADMRRRHAPGAHYFLETIGVRPVRQGGGVASRLLRPLLQVADNRRMPVYTETVTPENVPFYEHHGFVLVEARSVEASTLDVFGLLRSNG